MDLSIQVIKEPRGFIRIIQCIMAVLAFSTTAGFDTECEFLVVCEEKGGVEEIKKSYELEYPFSPTVIEKTPFKCGDEKVYTQTLPFDYSIAAEFFVTTGVLSFLYTIIVLVEYIFFHQQYANNPKLPVLDLGVSAVLAVFWMAGSSAWAQGVTDLKHYLHPDTVFKILPVCHEEFSHGCQTVEDGSYGVLNASLILGFANFILWTCSLWFVYKETVFHTPEAVPEPQQTQSAKGLPKV